jgi:uncharacterized protein YceH (UPF0502 family)
MHLLSGPVSIESVPAPRAENRREHGDRHSELEARIDVLERIVAEMQEKLAPPR